MNKHTYIRCSHVKVYFIFCRNTFFLLSLFIGNISLAASTELVNSSSVSGAISVVGEQVSYTFTSNIGESVQIQAADPGNTDFRPQITLLDPNGNTVSNASGDKVAILARYVTTASGTYTALVSNGFFGGQQNQTGNYNLYFVHMPGANEGGQLINGGMVSDVIDLGDIDS